MTAFSTASPLVDQFILAALKDGPACGTMIRKRMKDKANAPMHCGSMYRALPKLRKRGLIEPCSPGNRPDSKREKWYKITVAGLELSNQHRDMWARVYGLRVWSKEP